MVIKLEWLTETRFVPEEDFGICLSFPSVGSPKHKVLEVGLLKGHVQLKELPISPLGGTRLKRSSLSLSTRVVGAADILPIAKDNSIRGLQACITSTQKSKSYCWPEGTYLLAL